MSRRAGEATIVAAGYNAGDSFNSNGASRSDGMSYQQQRRRLFLPQELMNFSEGTGLIWPGGTSKSVPFYAPTYWTDPAVAHRAQPNPYYELRGKPLGRSADSLEIDDGD
jgi:type IV secretory pathway TraG/TraD family ATPase VirD4